MRILEAAGYHCTRASASLGIFDVVAVGPFEVKLVQVKAGSKYLSGIEREQIQPAACGRRALYESAVGRSDRAKPPTIARI